jgi:hypothetical protein
MLQFQFHRALCREAGYTGPLNRCSVYGNKKAGAKFQAMLEMGASKPWPEALKAIIGSHVGRRQDRRLRQRAARIFRAAQDLARFAELHCNLSTKR